MKPLSFLSFLLLLVVVCAFAPQTVSFEDEQKKFPRVSDAYERKEELFFMKCRSKEVSEEFGDMYIRVFKEENIMEIWVKNIQGKYVLFNECKVYSMSGHLGPKRQQGDAQVPEGFYYINDYNPVSNYHLSLGINYPNESDMKLSSAERKGGDIYIHGAQVSSGCIAMSNYYIEDIYLYAVKARSRGQMKIPVHIFPFKMTVSAMNYHNVVPQLQKYMPFWNTLTDGYRIFERKNEIPDVWVDAQGNYRYNNPIASTIKQ